MPPNNPRERMELFSTQTARGDHEAALATIEALIVEFPSQIPLHWYRARTLRTLNRDPDALEELATLLRMKADFAPAWLMRAEIAADRDGEYPEADLRQALKLDPGLGRAHLLLARWLTAQTRHAEAEDALERALKVDPLQADAYADRAGWYLRDAAQGFGDQGPPDPDLIVSNAGQRWSRRGLSSARADFEHSLEIRDDPEVRLRLAGVLQELGDYDAALAAFDAVLFTIPVDDPRHEQVRELRAQSARGEPADFQLLQPVDYRTIRMPSVRIAAADVDEEEAPPPAPSARALSREEALARFGGDDDEDAARALAHALEIYQLAYPPEPKFERTELNRFPRVQQDAAAAAAKALGAQAFRLVGDFIATHRGADTLVRIYVSNDGVSCATSHCVEPKVRGLAKFWMKLTGRWKPVTVTEFETAFDDGSFLITSNAALTQPLVHKGRIERVQLATEIGPASVYSRHRARIERYRREHPHATAERVDTEPRIFDLQRRINAARAEYRQSIGYVDDKELRHLLGEDYDFLAQRVRDKLAQLLAASAA